MHFTIEKLIQQEEEIVEYYKNAQMMWDEITKKSDQFRK